MPGYINPITVEFVNDQQTWDTVFSHPDERVTYITERMSHFTVEYDTEIDFDKAVNRFDGMVDFTVIR